MDATALKKNAQKCILAFFVERNLLLVYVFLTTLYIVCSSIKAYDINNYSWTEAFVNYAGGYIRRGLLGELLHSSAPSIDPRHLSLLLYSTALFIFMFLSHKFIRKNFAPQVCFLVFFSPILFLFYINAPGIFARKDIYILLATLLLYLIAISAVKTTAIRVYSLSILFVLVYSISYLVHEMAIFFFPLPFIVLGIAYQNIGKIRLWFFIGLMIEAISLYLAIKYSGTIEQREAIRASWASIYPSFRGEGSISYIGLQFSTWTQEVLRHLSYTKTVLSIIITMVLGAIPIFITAKLYSSYQATQHNITAWILRLLLPLAVLSPFFLMAFAQDFGRFIASGYVSLIVFLAAMQQLAPQARPTCLDSLKRALQNAFPLQVGIFLCGLIYAFGWTVTHIPLEGGSLIRGPWVLWLLAKYLQ